MNISTEAIMPNSNIDEMSRVLIVEDDAASRMLLSKTLRREGFEVFEAENGQHALEVFDEIGPHIVLMDVEMPLMNGFDACKLLRERNGAEHVPVLMVTGLEDIESVNLAYDAGATDFITKPINWGILGHRIRYLLRSSKIKKDLAQTVRELDNSRSRLTEAQRIAKLGNWKIDPDTLSMYWSEEVYRILGFDSDKDIPTLPMMLNCIHPDDREQVRHWFSLALKSCVDTDINHRVVTASNDIINVYQQIEVLNDPEGNSTELHGTIQDVTERQQFEEKIRELAYYDTLTGLPNRESFMMYVEQSIRTARRHNYKMAALFVDLDNFKYVNDTFGHSTGDLLLKAVAERLKHCLRSSDILGYDGNDSAVEMISRFGGDEFTILMSEIQRDDDAAIVSQRIIEALTQPLNLIGHEVVITPSIGIAVFPEDAADSETLFRNADTAMYSAKSNGKSQFHFYNAAMSESAIKRLQMESHLRIALHRNEFQLHYQPQMELDSNRVISVEALLRWTNDELGEVPPDTFIPVAEDSGLIIPIGEWVMHTACSQLRAWQDTGVPISRVAVNISVRQFMHPGFVELVERVLETTGLDAPSLELEITESLLMQNIDASVVLMNQLKSLGVQLAIDDFGTGYSSLSYLKSYPIDRLKIDRSFVRDLTTNVQDAAITKAVIAMANNMNLRVIAEGVETEEQLSYLTDKECHEFQGYYLSKAIPAHDVGLFVEQHNNSNDF